MKCPKCNTEAKIVKTQYVAENDDSPDIPTKLYIEQLFACRNPQCVDFEKVIKTVRNPLSLEKD